MNLDCSAALPNVVPMRSTASLQNPHPKAKTLKLAKSTGFDSHARCAGARHASALEVQQLLDGSEDIQRRASAVQGTGYFCTRTLSKCPGNPITAEAPPGSMQFPFTQREQDTLAAPGSL